MRHGYLTIAFALFFSATLIAQTEPGIPITKDSQPLAGIRLMKNSPYASEASPTVFTNVAEPIVAEPATNHPQPAPSTMYQPYGCAGFCLDNSCCQTSQYWGSAEYLIWWIKDGNLEAPLLTTGSATSFGALGDTSTRILYGAEDIEHDAFSGGRVTVGGWLGCDQSVGVELRGFLLERLSDRFSARSNANGFPVLARPIVIPQNGAESVELVAFPGAFSGNINLSTTTRLWGTELNLLSRVQRCQDQDIDLMVGFRYLDLDENITAAQRSRVLGNGISGFLGDLVLDPDVITIRDSIYTRNQFYGGQIGARSAYHFGKGSLEVIGKVAIGVNHQEIRRKGSTATTGTTVGGAGSTLQGGLYNLPTNLSWDREDELAILPELELRFSYAITCNIRGFVGYNLLYLSDVIRVGDQIDRRINRTQLPSSLAYNPLQGPPLPAQTFRQTDLWVQGFNFGIEILY